MASSREYAAHALVEVFDVPAAVYDHDDVFVATNGAFSLNLGYLPTDLDGVAVESVMHPESVIERRRDLTRLAGGTKGSLRAERKLVCADGSVVELTILKTRVTVENEPMLLVCVEDSHPLTGDIPEDEWWESTHDPLCGLLNRQGIYERIESHDSFLFPASLSSIELTNFEGIAARHGRQVLEEYVIRFSEILRGIARMHYGICARWSVDQFVLMVPMDEQWDANLAVATLRERSLKTSSGAMPPAIAVGGGRAENPDQFAEALSLAEKLMHSARQRAARSGDNDFD
ncbi:sensor domain-containing diguanylate cyclase [Williamsia sterculiae]|uniref:PAS domain S-box-containing protein n=1 Tax=Williamsia sterculiae TaxID=1344003 RepID=A0A1N7FLD2_9NOCA|nr:diguanylate cyclase [Williamsia sterculiae]SIS01218.1 PAS domain S-box-containing protein [Williamsia sterculiae]